MGLQDVYIRVPRVIGVFVGLGERLIIAKRIRILCRHRKVAIDMKDAEWLMIIKARIDDSVTMLGVYHPITVEA